MSCGSPHAVDCRQVIERVYLYLDGELTIDDCATIQDHLDECAPCLREYGVEREVRALIARSCGCDRAPESLRQRVLTRLREVRLEVDVLEYRLD